MNRIDFNQSVGFPLETDILAEMQTAWQLLNALGAVVGNFSIISGCNVVGSSVTDGVVYINGEVLKFQGGIATSKVIIKEDITALEFEDLTTKEVIFTRYVKFGTGDVEYNWADFSRGLETKTIQALLDAKASAAVVTDILTNLGTVITKLATIQEGAQVNVPQVKANWTETNPASATFVQNKPVGQLLTFLKKGTYSFADFSGQAIHTVSFDDIGTSNYQVLPSLVSSSSNWQEDDSVILTIRDKTATSFKFLLREVQGDTQTLTLEYTIVPK